MGGLLHDMPNYAKDDWDLEHMLHECTHGSTSGGRMKIKDQIIDGLKNLHGYRVRLGQRSNSFYHCSDQMNSDVIHPNLSLVYLQNS
jgi:hypothetical protein